MPKTNILTLSGGKDSVAMLFKCLEYPMKYPIDKVVFCNTGLEFDYMYEYLDLVNDRLKEYNLEIEVIGHGIETWDKWSKGAITKGKNKGIMRGFPTTRGMSWCTRELKVYPMNRYCKQFSEYNKYIGIAFDEPRRIKDEPNVMYPLVDFKMTEADCLEYTKQIGLYNKLYDNFKRLGCYLCPKQSEKSISILINKYPNHWNRIKIMEDYFIEHNALFDLYAIHGTDYFEYKLKEV